MTKEYTRVSHQFWTGETGRALKGNQEAQIVGMYLMTCEAANMIGVFRIPLVFISHDTGIPLEGASKGLQSLCEGGFCVYDESSEYVWVKKMGFWQVEDRLKPTDNRVKSVQKQVSALPNLPFLKEFYSVYGDPFHLEIAHKLEAPSKPLGSPFEASNSNSNSNSKDTVGYLADHVPREKRLEWFEGIWTTFDTGLGQKGSKKKATAQWEKLKPDESLFNEIHAALVKQISVKSDLKDRGQFYENFPHVERWLRDERWRDEIQADEFSGGDLGERFAI